VVRIRLKRFGRPHRPFYRIAAMDQRSARDSKTIEEFGTFNPIEKDQSKQIVLDAERAKYWLSVGAQPTDTVRTLLRRAGVELGKA
jgi:small subunit ribosomal protein S16